MMNSVRQSAQTLALDVRNLSVGYAGRVVVEDICVTLKPGEILALIGPNGSGKSSVLKTITKQLEPIGGVVEVEGVPVGELSVAALAKKMAVLLTSQPRTELLTCRDIVEAGRYPYTGKLGTLSEDDRAQVRFAMQLCEVSEFAECDFMRISDGQRQRVLLARAIAQSPRVLILDEPTSFLDIRYQLSLMRILRELSTHGVAIVAALHEIELARHVATTILCLKAGRIYAHGSPEEIFSDNTIAELYELDEELLRDARSFNMPV